MPMFGVRPPIGPYGFGSYGLQGPQQPIQPGIQAQPGIQQPQMPPQVAAMQPPVGMQPGMMQMNPQLLAQLAQLHGMGLGGGMRQQMPMFGRPGIQPINSGAYSLR